ncbi:CobW/HypB/UreG, nucleotide-binding domain-containing protein [Pelagophyceae sp. CCMP2097]|nr:CobW/HypB/UreG, nucleotide-binding domain-containing protein [Pelagophyceae sp. CCMP2097]
MSAARSVVNVVTGPLGAGKTTSILGLLKDRVAGAEPWALLVNEMGAAGIDGVALGGDGVTIREIAGGCMCCANGVAAKVALTQLLRSKPQRVLVEPSGLGHAAVLAKMLLTEPLVAAVELRCIVCLVPAHLHNELVAGSEIYREMIQVADALIITHGDRVSADVLAELENRLKSDPFPPKQRVCRGVHGEAFDAAMLDLPHAAHPDFAPSPDEGGAAPMRFAMSRVDGSKRVDAVRAGCAMVAWTFPQAALFDKQRLEQALQGAVGSGEPPLARLKGVFQTTAGPKLAQWTERGELALTSVPHAILDSRLQIIFRCAQVDQSLANALDSALSAAMLPAS